ncbi:MAG: leucine-rich repeat protein [Bacilli bacterium]
MGEVLKPYEGNRPYAFISYAHDDMEKVNQIMAILSKDMKFRLWYDSGLHSGDDWSNKLTQKINQSTAFIVFLSDASILSRHCASEISIAFNNEAIKIIPVWISVPKKLPTNLSYYLGFTQHAFEKMTNEPTVEDICKELNNSIPNSIKDTTIIEDGIIKTCVDDIKELIVDDTITQISDEVCKNKTQLNKVIFGKKLLKIGKEAFRNCINLTSIYIPSNIKHLGDSAFRDCVNITDIKIEKEIELGERAFENCRNLKNISLPNDLKEIYSGLFNSCKSLEKIKLPDSLIAIGDNAFGSCEALKELHIPPTVARIDDAAFVGCTGLTNIVIPEGVYKIGKNVFKDCSNLQSITLPASLVKIDNGSLRGCISLQSIDVNKKNKYYKSYDDIMFNKNKSVLICYPPVKKYDVYEIPDSVSEIEDWAFAYAKNLKQVIIPDSVHRIGEGAFFHCESLERIVIPYSVETIDDTAFRGCSNLKEVYIESETIQDLGWGIFYGCSENLVVYYCSNIVKKYCENQIFKSLPFTPSNPEEE